MPILTGKGLVGLRDSDKITISSDRYFLTTPKTAI